ncbi:MAG: helix-turn-helix domain-containing protein [Paracoccaceae bacterium]
MSFHEIPLLAGSAVPAPHPVAAAGLRIVVAMARDHDLMSLSILLDLLAAANRVLGQAYFHCDLVPEGHLAEAMQRQAGPRPPLLLVADAIDRTGFPRAVPVELARLWAAGGQVGGWGTGCLALAEAGLLSGRRFVMGAQARHGFLRHWPDLCPVDRSFCEDERVLTSVGKSVLSDMVLHLIHQKCGQQVMVGAMDRCLIRRAPGDGILDLPAVRTALPDPRILAIDRWIEGNIARAFRPCQLAAVAGISMRQLERLFAREMGRTPTEHVDCRRMAHARRLMRDTDMAIEDIARASGHLSTATFRKKFRRRFGVAPG